MISLVAAVFLLQPAAPAQQLLDNLRLSLSTGSEARVLSKFARPEDAAYLLRMAKNRGGLRNVRVAIFPTPPGWGSAPYWAVFHTFQDIESDHDPVHELIRTEDGLLVGREVPERLANFNRITKAAVSARIRETQSSASITANLAMQGADAKKATLFRLNDVYRLEVATVNASPADVVVAGDAVVPEVKEGQVLRAGSLIVPWTTKPLQNASFGYSGTVATTGEDKVNSRLCYLTAWWVPSTARLPHPTNVTVEGPGDWEIRSEGVLKKSARNGNRQTVSYECDLPISYPKIVGGRYRLAGSLTDRGRLFRAYQFEPVDSARGRQTVELAAKAVAWMEDRLAKFPFPGYDTFDAEGYYGIESYSYTLLEKNIVNRFVSHEIGHTYFGGMAPSAYVVDSWNESVTQYVDSVLYLQNADRSLEQGLRSTNLKAPLSVMAEPHDWQGHSYMRGAFVMRMLEHEIGLDATMKGLKALVTERTGKETTWPDLRPVFEKASGRDLAWFWSQWVTGAEFPNLQIVRWTNETWNGKNQTRVQVRQSGTPSPFRLRYRIRLTRGPSRKEEEVTMTAPEATFNVPSDFKPDKVELDVLGYALVDVEQT
ncbi:MAG TPA: M1 family aminopeptidase [Fimbriimonas sp.]